MEEEERLLLSNPTRRRKVKKSGVDFKQVAFVFIGILTLIYVLGELAVAIYTNSLVLLSDGFHNFSDVVSLYIAYWARKAGQWDQSDNMSYGWARSEILGGLTNGCFLISLCLYVTLQSIPKFIKPEPIESGWLFIVVAATGLVINTLGTIVFALTGQSHGHSHSHGHGHGHGHKEKHGHGHKEEHGHDHKEKDSHGHDHGHSHSHKKKKSHKKEGQKSHGHSHKISHNESVPLSLNSSFDSSAYDTGYSSNDEVIIHGVNSINHQEKDKKKHKKSHKKSEKKWDENVHAVFLHYLGDAISSVMVLIAGFLIHFFSKSKWVQYIDPVSSLLIVLLIVYTTIPLIKRCSLILLQSTPPEIPVKIVRKKILQIEGIQNIHDFHIWQLVDGMTIASVHIKVGEGFDFIEIVDKVKCVFHEFNIHSTAIQPEFVSSPKKIVEPLLEVCEKNCVENCEENWCCKPTDGELTEEQKEVYDTFSANALSNNIP